MNKDKISYLKDFGCCSYCNCKFDENNIRTIDHMLPKARGGTDEVSNLVWACLKCNGEKNYLTYEEYSYWCSIGKPGKPKITNKIEKAQTYMMKLLSIPERMDIANIKGIDNRIKTLFERINNVR